MIEMENIKVEWRDDMDDSGRMKRVTGKVIVPLFCEQGHEDEGSASRLDLIFRNGMIHRFGFISSSSWDFCDECGKERSEQSVEKGTNLIADLFKNVSDPDQQNLHQPINRSSEIIWKD
jgi:hypothetical protein